MMIEKIKYYVNKAWAPTVVVTMIFFIHYFFFGQENTIIGPFATLTFLRLRGMHNYKGCMVKNFAVYGVMALLSYGAMLHPICNILINAAALFWIAYFLIDEYQPRNYFPAGMALVFFQIAPAVGIAALGRRILALTVAFVIVFAFLMILDRQNKLSKVSDNVLKGLKLCGQLCDALENAANQQAVQIQHQLCDVNRRLCEEIYHHNRSQIGNEVSANKYCIFVTAFRIISSLTEDYLNTGNEKYRTEMNQWVLKYSRLYREIAESDSILGDAKKDRCMNDFVCGSRYSDEENDCRFDDKMQQNFVSDRKLKIRVNQPDIRSFRLRFALRQVCVVTPCLTFGYMSSLPNRYWLTISVFFMMIPLYERTFGRIAQRMKGTFFGLLLCIILFAFCRTVSMRILVMTVFNFFIYCSGGYTAMVTCITCSALAMNFSESNYLVMLFQRLAYTAAGALIAWAGNTWVFPIRASKQIAYIKEMFGDICAQLESALKLPENERITAANALVIRSYLLSGRMEDLNDALPEDKKCADCHAFLKEHLQTIAHLIFENG